MSEKKQALPSKEKVRDMIVYAGYNYILAHPEDLLLSLSVGISASNMSLGQVLYDYERMIEMIIDRMNELELKKKAQEE